ncbi:MAG: hypothetical protein RMA76_45500 [Deltaproteobacteria bacterium]
MSLSLVLLAVMAQPASQPAAPSSQPARKALKTGGTGADVKADAIIMVDVEESSLNWQESWTLTNESGKAIGANHLRIPVGVARLLRVDEDVPGFAAEADSSAVYATSGMGEGAKSVAFAYLTDTSGTGLTVRRRIPVNVTKGTLIFPLIDGLSVASNHPLNERTADMNGRRFLIYDIANIPAGLDLELTVSGLPSHSRNPRLIAGALAIFVLVWMAWALVEGKKKRGEVVLGALSPVARRDRIVKAIELLERDFDNDVIKEKRYRRRHEELMAELAAVLREIDLAGAEAR